MRRTVTIMLMAFGSSRLPGESVADVDHSHFHPLERWQVRISAEIQL